MKRPVIVYGSGGHGKVTADAALAAGREVLGFADDDPSLRGVNVGGLSIIATGLEELERATRDAGAEVALAIGNNRRRSVAFDALRRRGLPLATIIHPSAIIARSVTIGTGTVVFARAVVNVDSAIGANVIVNTGASIDHDCLIGDHAHLSPGVVLGGTVQVGTGTHLAVGVSVRNNVKIGSWTVVGVGAAVVGNLPDDVTALGVPARIRAQ